MAVTIKDVAKRAGVSISTVSKCINGGNVLEPKKSEILKAVEELNFKVNPIARGMKTKKRIRSEFLFRICPIITACQS